MRLQKEHWRHVITAAVVLVVFFCFSAYMNHRINQRIDALSSSLSDLSSRLDEAKKSLEEKDSMLQQTLGLVGESLNQTKKESQQQIQALTGELAESKQQIGDLESKLKNVKVSSSDFSDIIKWAVKSVVTIKTNLGEGSGFIVDENGYVVTNYHVIKGATNAGVFTYNNQLYAIRLVGYDSNIDIAILKMVTDSTFDALEFGDSSSVSVGERVIAVGNPAGLDFSVTEGIVSSTRKGSNGVTYLQTDVPINPGNSGGPLIDAGGEVVGINTLKIATLEGIGFAIAADGVKNLVERVIDEDKAVAK